MLKESVVFLFFLFEVAIMDYTLIKIILTILSVQKVRIAVSNWWKE